MPLLSHVRPLLVGAALLSGCAARDVPPPVSPEVVVLFSTRDDPEVRALACPEARCRFIDVERFACTGAEASARTVVITGHSSPPLYLQQRPEVLARAIGCFAPELLVLDTCYGFSAPLLDALAARELRPLVVGATFKLPPEGLLYAPRFFTDAALPAEERAGLVRTRSGRSLQRWTLSPVGLAAAHAEAAGWGPDQLTAQLQRIRPNLVKVPIPGSDATLLEPVEPARFRR
jgi:hypothetical protein